MNLPQTLSLIRLPVDVSNHHILARLSSASLLACSITCSYLRKISLRIISKRTPESNLSLQRDILHDLFKEGYLKLLILFQEKLLYPRFRPSWWLMDRCLTIAAAGEMSFYEYLFAFYYHLSFFNISILSYGIFSSFYN